MTKQFAITAIDFARQLSHQTTSSGVVDELARLTDRFGVESLTFCGAPKGCQDFAGALFAKRWSDSIGEWFSEYASKQYILSDPVVQRVRQKTCPFLWSDVRVDPARAPQAAALMRRRKDFGFNEAFVVPVHSPASPPAFVSMSGFQMELPADARPAIHLMALSAFERIREIRLPLVAKPLLTPREREVLSWVADGKCAWEIGVILKIAKRTVDEHVQAAARKLNASNRAHAVAIAITDHHILI